jgi:hypothetical protein
MIQFEQPQRQIPKSPDRKLGDDSGPKAPDVNKPDGGNELTRRLKNIDPNLADKYRQRSGQ